MLKTFFDLQDLPSDVVGNADALRPRLLEAGWVVLAEAEVGIGPAGTSTFWLWDPNYGEAQVHPYPHTAGARWAMQIIPVPLGSWAKIHLKAIARASAAVRRRVAHRLPLYRPSATARWGELVDSLAHDVSTLREGLARVTPDEGLESLRDALRGDVANLAGVAKSLGEVGRAPPAVSSDREVRRTLEHAADLLRRAWSLGVPIPGVTWTDAEVAAMAESGVTPGEAQPGDRVTDGARTFCVLGVRSGARVLDYWLLPESVDAEYEAVGLPGSALTRLLVGVPKDGALGRQTRPPMATLPRGFSGWRTVPSFDRWALCAGDGSQLRGSFPNEVRPRKLARRLNLSASLKAACRRD